MIISSWNVNSVRARIKNILNYIKSSNPDIIDSINSTGKLDEKIEKRLTTVIEEFKKKNIK